MSSSWSSVRIGDLCSIKRGASPRPIHDWMTSGDGIPWVKISDANSGKGRYVNETSSKIKAGGNKYSVEVFPGDLILSNSATPGIPRFMDIYACIHDGWLLLRDLRSIEKTFFYYLLEVERPNLLAKGNGSVFTNLKTDILREHKVSIPCVEEQKAIAHILGTLDDKIELNRKTNETLEGIAKALFKSWFMDFDPVRAKVAGRPTGLPDEISELFPDSFEDSELGEIPSGWRLGPLTQILQVDPKRSMPKGSVSPYLEMKGVPTSGHSAKGVYDRKFTSGTKFQNGDTLLARITPCLENGKTAMVDFLEEGQIGWGSTEFIVLCGIKPEHNSFAYYLARSAEFREHAIRNMVGSSGRQRVPSDALAEFNLAQAPISILNTFSSLTDVLLGRISRTSQENSTLSELRDALLPRLISGELPVPDAEKMLEEVGI